MLARMFARAAAAVWMIGLLASASSAQSAITGVVKDSSGGILPGVSVEASSPALIERIRTVVSDAQGRYAIVDLRPGVYRVTFTLQGFNTFVQSGIDLPSNFTATVNGELRVGAVEESVTVTGESPTVDVQNAQRTTVLSRQLLDAVPVPRILCMTMPYTVARPNPVPRPGPLVVKKGSNMCAFVAGSIPLPVSRTRRRT